MARKPGNDVLLKQGTVGDVMGDRPGGFDLVGGAKYGAWAALRGHGQSREDAQREYVALVETLKVRG